MLAEVYKRLGLSEVICICPSPEGMSGQAVSGMLKLGEGQWIVCNIYDW